ncbi:hypothetical protein BT67DRAFT_451539 [Trichocladium antarcticum]|uniref:Uncharacterized protein n=1 Tax=Trichocladium antarcticum TaxID=1450529 RepID=A0AAN6UHC4_9PEZI|nr:hypothetical protein BT67DRAFT_451539 [Trichocladium antarcticum]
MSNVETPGGLHSLGAFRASQSAETEQGGGGACGWTREGAAGEHAPTLLRLSRSRRPLATSWTMRPQSRVVIPDASSPPSPAIHDPCTPWEPHTTRHFTTEHVSCEPVGMVERRGGRAGSRLLADSEVESAFLRACKYIALVPRRPSSAKMANLHPASRAFRVQEEGPSAAIFGVSLHPPLPQDAYDLQRGGAGKSQADAILIPSDDEFDDLDGRSDTSFESLDGLLPDARNKVKSGRVTGTGKGVDAASDDCDTPEPSVTSMTGLDNESPASPIALHTEQDRLVPASPASRRALVCAGLYPNLSASFRRLRNAQSPNVKADNEGSEGDEAEPADARLPLQPPYNQDWIDFRRDVGGQCNTNLEADHRPTCPPVPDNRGEQNGMCPAVPLQVDDNVVRPLQGKRRRGNTSAPTTRRIAPPKRQTRLRGSALEEEIPLEAVLKRVLVDRAATFQVEFMWNPCTNYGRNDHTPETQRRKSLVGRTSSTARAFPLRATSTAKEVQDGEQGEEGREYLVK